MEFNKIANYYPGEEYSGLVILSVSRREGGPAKGISAGIGERANISDAKDTFSARRLLEPP